MPADPKMIRVKLADPLADQWDETLAAHKITGQAAVAAVLGWLVKQDPLTRSMIFGQVPEVDHADLTRLVLKRLAAGGTGKAKK